ncbi:MAG: hypothetical protein Q8S00_00940 [Deltaproteobacteria bacterium]|nr:hypothetical protein [Deltaproteobacteria bacterium]
MKVMLDTNICIYSGMGLKAADMLDLSFLERLEEERKGKGR